MSGYGITDSGLTAYGSYYLPTDQLLLAPGTTITFTSTDFTPVGVSGSLGVFTLSVGYWEVNCSVYSDVSGLAEFGLYSAALGGIVHSVVNSAGGQTGTSFSIIVKVTGSSDTVSIKWLGINVGNVYALSVTGNKSSFVTFKKIA